MKRHYHVTVGSQGGYLPDTAEMFTNRRDAESFAADEARSFLDDNWDREEPVTKSGSARTGLIAIEDGSLGYVIEVIPCVEADCEQDADA